MRKYCLTKLEEVIKPMFLEHIASKEPEGQSVKVEGEDVPSSALTDEDKALAEQKAIEFVADLEHCMMDMYAEPDKHGKPSAGPKYK